LTSSILLFGYLYHYLSKKKKKNPVFPSKAASGCFRLEHGSDPYSTYVSCQPNVTGNMKKERPKILMEIKMTPSIIAISFKFEQIVENIDKLNNTQSKNQGITTIIISS
jgi:hypothetical protein